MPWRGYDGRCDGFHDNGEVEVGGVDLAGQDVRQGEVFVPIHKY
jgi:hypothetical protein